MKNLRLMVALLAVLLLASVANAQDFIVLSDGSSIPAKVLEITQTDVKYKKASNPDGPTYTLPILGINYIKFENGTKETFANTPSAFNDDVPVGKNYGGKLDLNPTRGASDTALLEEALKDEANRYLKRASLCKKLAWGTLALGAATAIFGKIRYDDTNGQNEVHEYVAYTGIGVAIIGWTSFMVAARYQKKKARETRYLYSSLAEIPVLDVNGSQLSASVDMFRDKMTQDTSVGLGLKLTF